MYKTGGIVVMSTVISGVPGKLLMYSHITGHGTSGAALLNREVVVNEQIYNDNVGGDIGTLPGILTDHQGRYPI